MEGCLSDDLVEQRPAQNRRAGNAPCSDAKRHHAGRPHACVSVSWQKNSLPKIVALDRNRYDAEIRPHTITVRERVLVMGWSMPRLHRLPSH
jgi:hypothetical protein